MKLRRHSGRLPFRKRKNSFNKNIRLKLSDPARRKAGCHPRIKPDGELFLDHALDPRLKPSAADVDNVLAFFRPQGVHGR
jgi:hypothetical protein